MENLDLLKIQLYILEYDIEEQQKRLSSLIQEKEKLLYKINECKNSSNN